MIRREPPFSSPLADEARAGTYRCADCDAALFDSSAKYFTSTGWPTFSEHRSAALLHARPEVGATASAITCARCGGHLGDVFRDGPAPTGLRYCLNGAALRFVPAA